MQFFNRIKKFNQMYGLNAPGVPTYDESLAFRLTQFKEILQDELNEVDLILDKIKSGEQSEIDILTDLSDWLGDIIVYCSSEMTRHGLPSEDILSIIMDSNDSKLDANGNPIVINGKVQKGPGYWKPEPKIKELLGKKS